MTLLATLAGLFMAALIAGSILPLQSEAVLATLLATTDYSVVLLVATASVGNVLGSVINWLLGRGIERFRDRRWFPVGSAMLERAQGWYQRYGKWSLLMSWVPVIGDPLTMVAGVMREPIGKFVLLVALAKTARYAAVAALATNMT
ncbi:DedA family protein [Rhizobium sp. KVB221]|uniref:DedA family protein n=1 Tax=Rhizobium setariae TaxID=2801340 RepID=A0A936YWQ4_9HYPH|nr:YqaA family protein [Rhizobium setariae]MBL0374910.1 DedA family protein [Rhizobium setariae]